MSWSESFTGITLEEFKAKLPQIKANIDASQYIDDATKARQKAQVDQAARAAEFLSESMPAAKHNFWINGHANPSPGAGDSVGAGCSVFEATAVQGS